MPSSDSLRPLSFTQVQISDQFWSPRQATNRNISVEHCLQMLEKAGNFRDLELAAAGRREGYEGLLFTDSDLYKVLEGIAYTLATHPDPDLDAKVDQIIEMLAAAQEPDGYLNTWFQVTCPDQKFKNLRDWHELYCAGHLIEAAVAHFEATGKRNLLDVSLRFAELLYLRFGPGGEPGYCGHPELELALVRLASATGDPKWLELARLMVERHGSHYFAGEHAVSEEEYDGAYWQDDVPIREHEQIKGHAVRAAYLMSGVTDVAHETGDASLLPMLEKVWKNTMEKRAYVTGGIGPSSHNEGFTVDYDLPNRTAYQETCASIAIAQWAHRMALLHRDASYMDAAETALCNGLLSGISLYGKGFFYVNPLESRGDHHRQEWFKCACCPPNVLRTLASLGSYAYAAGAGSLYFNLYAAGRVEGEHEGRRYGFDVTSDYPWEGEVSLTCTEAVRLALHLRIPGWCESFRLSVNGEASRPGVENGYVVLERDWAAGDEVRLSLDMPVRFIQAHPSVGANQGRLCVARGPLIYCLEQVDHEFPIERVAIDTESAFEVRFEKGLLGGVQVIEGSARLFETTDWESRLYAPLPASKLVRVKLIPYGYWDNREAGAMRVWIPVGSPAPIV